MKFEYEGEFTAQEKEVVEKNIELHKSSLVDGEDCMLCGFVNCIIKQEGEKYFIKKTTIL